MKEGASGGASNTVGSSRQSVGSRSPAIDAIWRAHEAFVATDPLPQPDLPFWINLLEQQALEAREHEAAGRRDKALAEMADAVLVAFRAIYVATGQDPEPLIVNRIETRVIPRTREIAQRDRAGNGYKEARA